MDYLKYVQEKEIGPGGIRCVCCAPPPGKERRKIRRRARSRVRQGDRIVIGEIKSAMLSGLSRCPCCGYYAFNGVECFDCGYRGCSISRND
jgi:hypothetical protein